jgi:type VI secretion system secreted protein Hcp
MAAEAEQGGGIAPATRAFVRLVATGGETIGPLTRSGRAGWVEIHGWSHAVASPRDAASGLPTGKRRHEPLVITRAIDGASRRLTEALLDGEVLETCVLEVVRPTSSRDRRRPSAGDLLDKPRDEALEIYLERLRRSEAREERLCAIELTNARVADVEREMLDNTELENVLRTPRERVSFTYDRITWTWADGTSTEESWPPPTAASPTVAKFECRQLAWKKGSQGTVTANVRVVGDKGVGLKGVSVKGEFISANTGGTGRTAEGTTDRDGIATIARTRFALPPRTGFEFYLVSAKVGDSDLLGEELPGWKWAPGNRLAALKPRKPR